MICAFDIGGSKIATAQVSPELDLTNSLSSATPIADYAAFLDCIAGSVPEDAEAVGISIAGIVDPLKKSVYAANIPCISGKPLAAALRARLKKPVYLINDANAFALFEAHSGIATGYASVLAAILGTGLGGAIVREGVIQTGANGLAGEWGHGPAAAMRTGRHLPRWQCGCGQFGCADVYCGARGLERLHAYYTGRKLTTFDILAAWQEEDADASQTLDLYLDVLGGALANAINIIDPDIVVLGGGLTGNTHLVSAIEREIRNRILNKERSPRLATAPAGPDSALKGAAIFARSAKDLYFPS